MCFNFLDASLISLTSLVISFFAFFFAVRNSVINRRPHLIFTEEQVLEDNTLKTGFYLKNIGLGPAFNVSISEDIIKKHDFLKSFAEIPRNIASNKHTLFYLINGNKRIIDNNLVLLVEYEEVQGNRYQTALKQMKHSFKRLFFHNIFIKRNRQNAT